MQFLTHWLYSYFLWKLEMGVSLIQMNFIHLLSFEAVQMITIHCLNVPVWASGDSNIPSSSAVYFKAWNGQIIESGGFIEPEPLKDECWVSFSLYKLSLYGNLKFTAGTMKF